MELWLALKYDLICPTGKTAILFIHFLLTDMTYTGVFSISINFQFKKRKKESENQFCII